MFTFALLALLQAPAPVPHGHNRQAVVHLLDQFDKDLADMEQFATTRFAADTDLPKTGLAVDSLPEPGPDGLHAMIVITVLGDGPADRAGILPGDRIIRVGKRRIEHETVQAFRKLVDDKAGPLEMTVRRGGSDLVIIVDRAPLTCMQRAAARLKQSELRARFNDMHRLSAMIRSGLDDARTPPDERYAVLKDAIAQLYGLLNESAKALSMDLMLVASQECQFKSAP